MRCRGPLTFASVVAVAALSLLAAGCGGGGSPGVANIASSTTAAATTTTQNAAVAYTTCMRSQGVPAFPDPTSGGEIPKVSLQQLRSATLNSRPRREPASPRRRPSPPPNSSTLARRR